MKNIIIQNRQYRFAQIAIGLFVLLLSILSCEKETEPDASDGLNPESEYSSLFTDIMFENGFSVSSTDEGNGNAVGTLDYDGKATDTPVWKIGQWNCINNDLMNATYSFVDDRHEYRVDTEGNRIAVDTKTGTLTLELNSSTEYGKNGIASNPRRQNEPWPALLCEYYLSESQILKVADKEEIHMVVDYKITKIEDKTPLGRINPNLHAAQFQWFITIQNRNKSSEDFGQYIWFGFDFHDTRYDFTPAYYAEDGGKENNTGAFIYMTDMQLVMSDIGKAEVNKRFEVDINVLPIFREAFALAQERNYLTETKWEDLYVGASNIGWEVPGTYDVAVEIYQFDIKYR